MHDRILPVPTEKEAELASIAPLDASLKRNKTRLYSYRELKGDS